MKAETAKVNTSTVAARMIVVDVKLNMLHCCSACQSCAGEFI